MDWLRLYVGRRKYGKSTLLAEHAVESVAQGDFSSAYVCAPWGDAWGAFQSYAKVKNYTNSFSVGRLNRFTMATSLEVTRLAISETVFRRGAGGPTLLILDELDRAAAGAQGWSERGNVDDLIPGERVNIWNYIENYGRHIGQLEGIPVSGRGVALWGSARRFSAVPYSFRANCDRVFAFCLKGANDCAMLSREYPDMDGLSERVRVLERFHAVEIEP